MVGVARCRDPVAKPNDTSKSIEHKHKVNEIGKPMKAKENG